MIDIISLYCKKKVIIYLFLIFVFLLSSFYLPFQFILNFAHDDSFFYLKTSQNFVNGIGTTFDGINPTNGFHPLYFLIISALFFLTKLFLNPTPEFLYRMVFLFHLIMVFLITIITFRSTDKINLKANKIKRNILLFIILFVLVFIRDFGIESHLGILIIAIYLYLKALELNTNKYFIYSKSICLALLYLTRTDFLFTLIPIAIIADIILIKDYKIKLLIAYLITLSFVFILNTGINYYYFHHFSSVSSVILNTFPKIKIIDNFNQLISNKEKIFNQFARLVFLVGVLILFLTNSVNKKVFKSIQFKYGLNLFFLCLGSLLWAIIHLMFNLHGLREWYLTLPVFLAALLFVSFTNHKYFYYSSL
ncbi:MAG TPA: hypothetical protein VIK14_06660, partial [Ignavibacteria bacterium]